MTTQYRQNGFAELSKHFSFHGTLFLLGFALLLSSCVSRKKYAAALETNKVQESRIEGLKKDSLDTHARLERVRQDSSALQGKLYDLQTSQYKSENNRNPQSGRSVKTRTISEAREYEEKTTYVYNISKYIDWAPEFKNGNFIIGVLGKSKLEDLIRLKVNGKKNGTQPYAVYNFANPRDIETCHILFIPKGSASLIPAVRSHLGRFPVVIITEEDSFRPSSHMNISVDGDEVKLWINKEAMKALNVKTSKLLMNMSSE